MADRLRRRTLNRLALLAGAAALLAFGAPAAFGFEGPGRHGPTGNLGAGLQSGPISSPGLGMGGGARGALPAPTSPLAGGDGAGLGHGLQGRSPVGDDHGLHGGNSIGGGHADSSGLGRGSSGKDDAPGRGGDHGLQVSNAGGRRAGASARGAGRVVEDAAGAAAESPVAAITQSRQRVIRQLLRRHPEALEADALGDPVVRGQILAIGPSDAGLAKARKAGFQPIADDAISELGLRSVVLAAPAGVGAAEALRRIRELDPQGRYDLNHVYQESGKVISRHARPHAAPFAPPPRGLKLGLVDGGVSASLPALSGARIVQQGFAPGAPVPSAHATAVASLLAGRKAPFRGAAPGATLYVADVYGSTSAGGSAEAIARALGWLAKMQAPVINISLVGPPNLLLAAAVEALIARGHLVVAAVGNDGPAAPPLYPASYPGVVAVTGVDAHRRVLPEAGRAAHVDFAAPGSDMAAAGLDGGFVSVRGTSFAAPIAAGLLARLEPEPDPVAAARALAALKRQALDLGPRGPDPAYGQGLVGLELRTAPAAVHARMALRGP